MVSSPDLLSVLIFSLRGYFQKRQFQVYKDRKIKGGFFRNAKAVFRTFRSSETFLGLEPEGEKYSKDYKRIYFVIRREKEPIPLHLKRDPNSLIYEVVDSVSLITGKITKEDIARVLKNSFNGKASYKDLVSLCSDQFGVQEGRISNLMKELKDKGVIDKESGKRGCWFIKKSFSTLF